MSNSCPKAEKDLSRSTGLNYDRSSMFPFIVRRLAPLLLWLPLFGCATQADEQNKRLNELNDRLQRVQSTTVRLEERVAALEGTYRALIAQPRAASNSSNQVLAPKDLPVVKMAPRSAEAEGNDAVVAGPEPDEPRTLIVGEGTRVEARSSADASGSPPAKRAKDKATSESTSKKPSNATVSGNKAP
jgi:hypothetical protein